MQIEQTINILLVLSIVLYASRGEVSSVTSSLRLLGVGTLFVLAQFGLNKILGGDMRGMPLSTKDVLTLQEISYNFCFVVVGYSFIGVGIFTAIRSLVVAHKHPLSVNEEDQVDEKHR